MVNYIYDCYTVLNKVYSEKAFIKQAFLTTPIEEKNKSLIIKTCYGVLEKDIELSYYLSILAPKNPKLAIRTILKISMYAIKYLSKHSYAITANAVELCKKLGKGGACGFINAFLRKFATFQFEFPKNTAENLSIKYSYPLFAVQELLEYYGKEITTEIIGAEQPLTTLAFYGVNGEEYLTKKGYTFSKTPFNNVYSVKNFIRNDDYDKGVYTYQALGSVAICDIVDPCESILDCCAAPGGKSIRLSYKCGSVTSWDIHEHRVGLINDYKYRMNRHNITATVKDAKEFSKQFESCFDAVLCDSPCSGLGVVGDNPDIKLNKTKDAVKELNKEQLTILKTVSKYVKKGGCLYYSTCSVLPSENIAIINSFMSDTKGYKLEKITSNLPYFDIDGTVQFLPHISGGLGFYVAKLKRID